MDNDRLDQLLHDTPGILSAKAVRRALIDVGNPSVDFDLTPVDANSFTAELLVNGNSRSQCRVWIGGLSGNGNDIGYYEGRWDRGSNSLNESLGLVDEDGELFLSSMMGAAFGDFGQGLDLKKMTADEGAEYLWRRFVQPLERRA